MPGRQIDLAGSVEDAEILHAKAGQFVDCSTDAAVVRRDIRIERGCGGSHAGGELGGDAGVEACVKIV